MKSIKFIAVVIATITLTVGAPGMAWAGINLVQNGSFEQTTNGGGQLGYNTNATGWTTSGYNFLFTPGSADNAGVTGQYGNLKLWGPGTGSANGLPATSPDGGNFVAADGAYNVGAISQSIGSLVVGQNYQVSFYWGAAQQYSYTGTTTEQWKVSLGGQTQSTVVASNVSHGFTGWMYETMNFTATSATETLSFLSIGTPSGVPPFALLDGVSLVATPEPASIVMMVIGLTGIIGYDLRRRRRQRSGLVLA